MQQFLNVQERTANVGSSIFSVDCLAQDPNGVKPFYIKSLVSGGGFLINAKRFCLGLQRLNPSRRTAVVSAHLRVLSLFVHATDN
jgi:hypothetical protein